MRDAPKLSHETLFADALARPAHEREVFVDRACADDPAMAAYVKELLRGYEENSGFLETSPAGVERALSTGVTDPGPGLDPAGSSAHPVEPAPGEYIGHYKLLERIGEGACGIVYMAEQEQPVRRRVALKLIKLGLDTREHLARFETERQALAMMDHPNIARVFDAGATDKGRPYFVMELVRGTPITQYCDENRLPPPARLELFILACQAIQHAHQKGIIHRDIKPSNILVAVDDGAAVPKVIDFGIAKATQRRLTDRTLFTHFHAFIGTPAYSSPEQADVTNLDVDTRSDIYSLGVLLYELLTGQQPVDAATIERLGFEELRRLIREVEPPRPSVRVSSLGQDARTTIARRRNVDPGNLALLLRSDLDWIVMRCLEKDRRRRYESANALAEDVRHYLDNEPVAARPPSAAYRIRKFVSRHRSAVVAVGGIAAALVAGLIVSSALFLRERTAHARAVAAERAEGELRAQAEAGRAREIKRSSRTALNLARQLLTERKTSDGIAYLVHAARRDPENTAIAARLLSTLASRNFLLPEHAPFACGARVLALRYTNDGRSLLVGTEDGTLRIFDSATGALIREVRLGREVKRNGWVFPSDDDRVCAIRFKGDTLGVLDIAAGRLRFPPRMLDPRVLPGEGVNPMLLDAGQVIMSPDGRWILTEGLFEYWLWDASNGEIRLQRSLSSFKFCAFSPDGSRFAEVTDDAWTLWSLPECRTVIGPIPVARHIARRGVYLLPHFSRDGRELAIVDPWEGIHVFDAASGELRRSWPHRDNWIFPGSLQVLPDGRLFVGSSHATELLDLQSGRVESLPHTAFRNVQACVPDAAGTRVLIVTPAGFGQLVDTASGRWIAEETALRGSGDVVAALSPDGTRIAAGTGHGEVRWLQVGRGAAQPLEFPAITTRFTSDTSPHVRAITPREARVIDVRTGKDVATAASHPHALSVRWSRPWLSPGARFLLVPDPDAHWEAWDYSTGGPPRVVVLEGGSRAHFFEFSPDGAFDAFFGRNSREIGVWNLVTGKLAGPLVSYDNDTAGVWTTRLGIAGRRLITGHSKGTVAIWETESGRLIRTLQTTSRATPSVIHLSPDGRKVAVSTAWGESRIWDVETGKPVSPAFEVAPGGSGGSPAPGALFSPDGRWFATVGAQGTTLRDATTFAPVGNVIGIRGGAMEPHGTFFNRDGTRLFADSDVWDVPSGELIVEPMTAEETRAPGGVQNAEFSPDGNFLLYQFAGPTGMITRIRSLPPPLPHGASTPEWLLQLATMIAGKVINDTEQCVAVPASQLQVESLRRELASLPAGAPYAEWGLWMLDQRADRPIAPGFTISPTDAGRLREGVFEKSAAD
jgi:eukaryotic-like serine/threonine-protein kinase